MIPIERFAATAARDANPRDSIPTEETLPSRINGTEVTLPPFPPPSEVELCPTEGTDDEFWILGRLLGW